MAFTCPSALSLSMINDQSRWIRNVQTRRLHPSHVLLYSFDLEKNMVESFNVHVRHLISVEWKQPRWCERKQAVASSSVRWEGQLWSNSAASSGHRAALPSDAGVWRTNGGNLKGQGRLCVMWGGVVEQALRPQSPPICPQIGQPPAHMNDLLPATVGSKLANLSMNAVKPVRSKLQCWP